MAEAHIENNRAQFERMTGQSIPRLIITMAIPTSISMVVSAVYNIGDTFFVSQLGTSASAAVGVVMPLMTTIQAVGFMLGMGAGSNISRLLGEHKIDRSEKLAATAMLSAVVFGLILTLCGVSAIEPLMLLLGASKGTLPHAVAYARYILWGAPIMTGSYVLNNVLRCQGKARYAMIGIASGGILNLLLDPIFIFKLDMGIAGAAIATLISQSISFLILLSAFVFNISLVRLSVKNISPQPHDYFTIIVSGLPSFMRQALASIATIALNRAAVDYGDSAVAAMSIVGKVFFIIFAIGLGIGQGYMPVLGYNYGAKRFDRARQSFVFTFFCGTGVMAFMSAVVFISAPYVLHAFIGYDADAVAIGIRALRYQCCAMPLAALGVCCNMTFQTIGKSLAATVLSAARQGVFFIPAILLLPGIIGLTGIELAQAAADVCTFILCVPFALYFLRTLPKEQCPQEA